MPGVGAAGRAMQVLDESGLVGVIRNLRQQEHEADVLEDQINQKVFNSGLDPVTVFHMVRLAETVGSIADHAENAGDMMRAMVAR